MGGMVITQGKRMAENITPPSNPGNAPAFEISGNLLYGGKGKNNIVVKNVNYQQPNKETCVPLVAGRG